MENKLTDKIWCLLTFGGIEIWLNKKQKEEVLSAINNELKVITVEGRFFNTSSIDGVYKADDIENMRKHKRGMWQCKYENWHSRNDLCECGRSR